VRPDAAAYRRAAASSVSPSVPVAAWQDAAAASAHEPHRIAFYLYDLAAAFHAHWNRGRDESGLRFIVEDDIELTRARLALVQAVGFVIGSGLKVFGVTPVEEMR
jgi:arginyl-tRNA synthetase